MTTDLAAIEAALAAATPGPWAQEEPWEIRSATTQEMVCDIGRSQADAHLIVLLRNTAAELVERVRTAEAEVERLTQWKAEALPMMDDLQELGQSLGLPLGAQITGPLAHVAAEALNARAEGAEATIARVRELAARFDGYAKFAVSVPDSELYAAIAAALLNALDANPTDVTPTTDPESATSGQLHRFTSANSPEVDETTLRAGVRDGESGRCTSDITLRDEEHRLARCRLTAGHDGDHEDGHGVTWTGGGR